MLKCSRVRNVAVVERGERSRHSKRWRLKNEEVLMKHNSHQRDFFRVLSAVLGDYCVFVRSANCKDKLTAFGKHADAWTENAAPVQLAIIALRSKCKMYCLIDQLCVSACIPAQEAWQNHVVIKPNNILVIYSCIKSPFENETWCFFHVLRWV